MKKSKILFLTISVLMLLASIISFIIFETTLTNKFNTEINTILFLITEILVISFLVILLKFSSKITNTFFIIFLLISFFIPIYNLEEKGINKTLEDKNGIVIGKTQEKCHDLNIYGVPIYNYYNK